MQSVIANYKKKKIISKKIPSVTGLNTGFTALPIKTLNNINKTSQFKYRTLKRKKEIRRNNKMVKKNSYFKEALKKNLQTFEEKSLRKSSLITDQLLKQKSIINEKLKKRRERSLTLGKKKSFISKLKNKIIGRSQVFDSERILDSSIRRSSFDFKNKNLEISIIEGSLDNNIF